MFKHAASAIACFYLNPWHLRPGGQTKVTPSSGEGDLAERKRPVEAHAQDLHVRDILLDVCQHPIFDIV